MLAKTSIRFVTSGLEIVLLLSLVACTQPPPYPPHAHYHAHDYYYYPSVRVYFRYSTGYYYYPSGSIWIRTRTLPPKYRLDQRDRVVIRIEDKKPYARHYQHREKYRPHPDYRPDPYRDEKERHYNKKRYEQYRKNY
jgi:hypothetical protein